VEQAGLGPGGLWTQFDAALEWRLNRPISEFSRRMQQIKPQCRLLKFWGVLPTKQGGVLPTIGGGYELRAGRK
jgi:hypothetical protein